MILKSKICGVSDLNTLNYIVDHTYPPQFIGFIVNYPKSKRYVDKKNLQKLLKINKKKSLYVAVLVNPEKKILEDIKDFPFDYYQLYNCDLAQIEFVKKKYNKKIITAITVETPEDVKNYIYLIVRVMKKACHLITRILKISILIKRLCWLEIFK